MSSDFIPPEHDAWLYVEPHIGAALVEARKVIHRPGLVRLAEARYRAGEREYHRDWLGQPITWFDQMAAEEAADLVDYLAMRRVVEAASSARWR